MLHNVEAWIISICAALLTYLEETFHDVEEITVQITGNLTLARM